MNRTPLTLVPLAAALALAACGAQPDAANTAAPTLGNDTTPEGPNLAAQLFGGGKPQPLNIQAPAANGMIVYLSSIQAKDTETVIAMKVVNGFHDDVELNWSTQKTFLVAGGQKFFLSPPLENKDLKVTGSTTMQGELVFLGRLPKTGTITLVFNDGMSNSEYSRQPNLSIPIQVSEAAWSDDGSKKKLSRLSFAADIARSSLKVAPGGTGSTMGSGGVGTSAMSQVDTLKSDLGATQTDRGTLVSLPGDVLFDYDKAVIRDDAKPQLDKVAELIKAQNPPTTAIEGHSDGKGDDTYNQKLSERRAMAVRDYLISVRTVDGTKLTTKGLGELKPVAPNQTESGADDPAGRAKNRRVEVILSKP